MTETLSCHETFHQQNSTFNYFCHN